MSKRPHPKQEQHFTATQTAILYQLHKKGAMHRMQLVEALNLSRTTIYDNLKKLLDTGHIEKYYFNDGKRGRNRTMWRVRTSE